MYDDIVMNVIQNKGLAQASNDFRAILINKFDDMPEIRSRLASIEKYKNMRDLQISANTAYKPDPDLIS
ncbi:hypothetical phage protein [Campylobacter phage CP220]|uniref:Hypothetical phage protein n=1 Tax=Campylobacter phage CP220 TaxID=2994044 RepID=D5GVI6_9CAUD|nr:hypothetical protein APL47_gp126 [Campylobacter phage CP220]CBJ94003.1 hypothetical phage protein [Campylobacter phage CP220]